MCDLTWWLWFQLFQCQRVIQWLPMIQHCWFCQLSIQRIQLIWGCLRHRGKLCFLFLIQQSSRCGHWWRFRSFCFQWLRLIQNQQGQLFFRQRRLHWFRFFFRWQLIKLSFLRWQLQSLWFLLIFSWLKLHSQQRLILLQLWI